MSKKTVLWMLGILMIAGVLVAQESGGPRRAGGDRPGPGMAGPMRGGIQRRQAGSSRAGAGTSRRGPHHSWSGGEGRGSRYWRPTREGASPAGPSVGVRNDTKRPSSEGRGRDVRSARRGDRLPSLIFQVDPVGISTCSRGRMVAGASSGRSLRSSR